MKLRVQEQFICYLFVAILFLSGMCVDIPTADAPFLYANEASVSNTTGSVIRDGSRLVTLERVCTISMLRRDTTTFLSGNRRRSQVKRFLQNVAALLAVEILLFYIFCLGGTAEQASWKLIGSHATIVRYIQQTDGKK